jgi:hypothetical protein
MEEFNSGSRRRDEGGRQERVICGSLTYHLQEVATQCDKDMVPLCTIIRQNLEPLVPFPQPAQFRWSEPKHLEFIWRRILRLCDI